MQEETLLPRSPAATGMALGVGVGNTRKGTVSTQALVSIAKGLSQAPTSLGRVSG